MSVRGGGSFGDLSDFWAEGLPLTIKGKDYVIPEPSAELGLYVQSIFSAAGAVAKTVVTGESVAEATKAASHLDDAQETNLYRRMLGPVYDELIADGASWRVLRHVGQTAMFWIAIGEDAARAYWQGDNPLALGSATNREERRAQTRAAKTAAVKPAKAAAAARSTSSRAGTATPKPASPSGTRSRATKSTSSPKTPRTASLGKRS